MKLGLGPVFHRDMLPELSHVEGQDGAEPGLSALQERGYAAFAGVRPQRQHCPGGPYLVADSRAADPMFH